MQTVKLPIVKLLSILIPLGLKYSSMILFLNALNLHYSISVKDHVSQPYSTTGDTTVLRVLIFKFFERSLEDESVWTEK